MKNEGFLQYDSFYVAGYQYYDGDSVLRKLKEGQELKLIRDAFNPYDHRAVEVRTDQEIKLGFIPRKKNRMTAFFIDNRLPVLALIREIQYQQRDNQPIRVDLFVKLGQTGNKE